MSIITFCGHNEINIGEEIKKGLYQTIEQEIKKGATEFYLGGYGHFDHMAANMVWELKENYPYIRSVLILAYLNREVDMKYYDETIYPPLERTPPRYAISKRNEWMVTQASVIIAYVTHDWGGAAQTLKFARRKHKLIINLAETATKSI